MNNPKSEIRNPKSNPPEEQLRRALERNAERGVPGGADLWPQLHARLGASPLVRRRLAPKSLAIALGACAVLILALGSAVVGMAALSHRNNDRIIGAQIGGLGDENVPPTSTDPFVKSSNGYTVHLYPVSVDANMVVISYTLTAPDGTPVGVFPTWTDNTLALLDSRVKQYPLLAMDFPHGGLGLPYWSQPSDLTVLRFSALPLGPDDKVNFTLRFNLARFGGDQPPAFNAPTLITPSPLADYHPTTLAGPFNFNFTMTVDHTQRSADLYSSNAELGQRQAAANIVVTLDRAVVTASQMRLSLRINDPNGAHWKPNEVKSLIPNFGGEYALTIPGGEDGSWLLFINAPYPYANDLMTFRGEWVVAVNTLDNIATGETVAGPWYFRFYLPLPDSPEMATPGGPPNMTATITVDNPHGETSWLEVIADGATVFQGDLAAASAHTFSAGATIKIRSGRADLVRVAINGADKGFLGDANHLIVTRTWDSSGTEIDLPAQQVPAPPMDNPTP